MEYRGLLSMPEFIPSAGLQQLSNDGVNFIKKSSTKLCHHVIEINRLISDRINNCKSLFPVWINWAYLKELVPHGITIKSCWLQKLPISLFLSLVQAMHNCMISGTCTVVQQMISGVLLNRQQENKFRQLNE